jgi:hypothetical protein
VTADRTSVAGGGQGLTSHLIADRMLVGEGGREHGVSAGEPVVERRRDGYVWHAITSQRVIDHRRRVLDGDAVMR